MPPDAFSPMMDTFAAWTLSENNEAACCLLNTSRQNCLGLKVALGQVIARRERKEEPPLSPPPHRKLGKCSYKETEGERGPTEDIPQTLQTNILTAGGGGEWGR